MDTAPLGTAMAGAWAAGFFDDFETMTDTVSIRAVQSPDQDKNRYYSGVYKLFDKLYGNLEPIFEELSALSRQGGAL